MYWLFYLILGIVSVCWVIAFMLAWYCRKNYHDLNLQIFKIFLGSFKYYFYFCTDEKLMLTKKKGESYVYSKVLQQVG